MAIAAFAYGFVITLVFSPPADWAALATAALVVGIVLAGVAGDAAATALWGRARFRSR